MKKFISVALDLLAECLVGPKPKAYFPLTNESVEVDYTVGAVRRRNASQLPKSTTGENHA